MDNPYLGDWEDMAQLITLTPVKENKMDPAATLINAEIARVSDPEECAELLSNYFEWRLKGGFQPDGGDATAIYLLRRLGEDCQKKSE